MPIFQYTAMDPEGKEQKGKREAVSEEALATYLKDQGLFITSITLTADKAGKEKKKEKKEFKDINISINLSIGGKTIRKKNLLILTRQLAILLDAGLPLLRSLKTLERQSRDAGMKYVLGRVAASVEGGSTFSEALAQHPKSFDKLYLNMIRAGEAAGKLELILSRLSEFMEKSARIAGKVKSAMVYPICVLVVALGIGIGLMIFVIPSFKSSFEDMLEGDSLPWLTLFVMGLSDMLINNILEVLIGIVGIIVLYIVISKTKWGKYGIDWVKYNIPLFGPIVSRSAISKFSRTLGTLMSSGVPVLTALNIVRDTSGNDLVANAVQQVHDAVKEGEGMAGPLGATKIFPDMVVSMIEVGEETGRLPEMLEKVANTYDEEVDNAVTALTSMIEPIMIVTLAVIVGTIVIAMFLPMIALIDKLGNT